MGCEKPVMPFAPSWAMFPHWAGYNDYANTVPQIYWNIESNEQRYHFLCKRLHMLACYADMLSGKVNLNRADIDKLMADFQKFMESGFDDYYLEQIEQWVNDNLETLYKLLVKQVYFGLNEQGYFVAYIPESWDDIFFDTGMNYGQDTYGRLILRWDVDNSGETVNQRPEDWS